jgi:hypothetical protein
MTQNTRVKPAGRSLPALVRDRGRRGALGTAVELLTEKAAKLYYETS